MDRIQHVGRRRNDAFADILIRLAAHLGLQRIADMAIGADADLRDRKNASDFTGHRAGTFTLISHGCLLVKDKNTNQSECSTAAPSVRCRTEGPVF